MCNIASYWCMCFFPPVGACEFPEDQSVYPMSQIAIALVAASCKLLKVRKLRFKAMDRLMWVFTVLPPC